MNDICFSCWNTVGMSSFFHHDRCRLSSTNDWFESKEMQNFVFEEKLRY